MYGDNENNKNEYNNGEYNNEYNGEYNNEYNSAGPNNSGLNSTGPNSTGQNNPEQTGPESGHNEYNNEYNNNEFKGSEINSTAENKGGVYSGGGNYSGRGRYSQGSPYRGTDMQGGYGNYNIPPRQENPVPPAHPAMERPAKKPGFFLRAVAAIFLGLFFGVFAAAGFYGAKVVMEKTGVVNTASPQVQAPSSQVEKTTLPNLAEKVDSGKDKSASRVQTYSTVVTDVSTVVDSAMPSMVAITNKYTAKQSFFGQTFESQGEAGGSGIIVGENDTEYLIVTNQHVISRADDLLVKFIDQEEVTAYVKGYDTDQDIAVIAVKKDDVKGSTAQSIKIAAMGDSDALTLGEPTIAIGNALGYGQSVTTGVVSALDREIGNDGKETFIQTDAAINPGNSGGALLNISGEVIGINSNKFGGAVVEGMGYAIPISRVKPLIEDFMTRATKGEKAGKGKQAYLGITGVDVTDEVADTYNMPKGVYVAQVHEDAAAAKAGLEMGDIITKFDGSSVKSMTELQEILSYYEAGAEITLQIQRGTPGGYTEKNIKVILGNREDMQS